MNKKSAILAFEDGTICRGKAFGATTTVVGEAVFNTSMTGYQEIITDPSYFGQIITMTAPQIGNYGINFEDSQSDGAKCGALVVRELSPVVSNWRAKLSLSDYLKEYNIPGIEGVDTRTISKKIRSGGALKACISTEEISDEQAVQRARDWQGLVGVDFAKEVSCKAPYDFDKEKFDISPFTVVGTDLYNRPQVKKFERRIKLAAIDFGAKKSTLTQLAYNGFDVKVFPADVKAEDIINYKPEAMFLSNGPGDPSAVTYAHKEVAKLISKYPMFGICFGHQVITHAIGAKTFKLKFGHRGGNQPVKDLETSLVTMTSQNHGFASDEKSLEKNGAIITQINLNDSTVEAIRLKDYPVFSVQYHPEACPGPNDTDPIFEKFYNNCLATLK